MDGVRSSIDVLGVPIAYASFSGSSTGGTPIVLVHGSGSSKGIWSPLVEALGASRGVVHALDLPGHGDSGRLEGKPYGPAFFAGIIAGFLDAVGAQECVLVAHSLGGHLVMETADRLRSLRGVLLLGAPPLENAAAAAAAFKETPVTPFMFKGDLTDDERRTWAEAFAPTPASVILPDLVRADGRVRSDLGVAFAAAEFRDERAAFASFPCPKILAFGAADQVVDLEFVRRLDLPGFHVIPGAGHYAQIDAPAALAALVRGLA